MSKLKVFLEKSFNTLKEWRKFREIHIILGNEACDLDSTICSLSYGYYLSQKLNYEKNEDIAIFPIINVPSDEFLIRTEHCSLLKNLSIDLDKLIYRSAVNFEEVVNEKKDSIKTYLVDHHVLTKNDIVLQSTVCKIFDHRPVDESAKWSSNVILKINQVGSCATIIADEILKENGMLFKELAYLLYCTIVFDTLAVRPENKKATPLDIEVVEKLELKFEINECKLTLFQKLVELHADITNLTPKQLLIRDLKFVDNIPIPGLPMLSENFLKLDSVEQDLKEMASKHKASFIVMVGIEAKPDVKRDIALYVAKSDSTFKNLLVNEFKSKTDFKFEEVTCTLKDVVILKQLNIEKSRKQIIPIVKNFVDNVNK